MRFSQQITITSIALLCTLSQAIPVYHLEIRNPDPLPLAQPQSYSVVPVDGGSNGQPATKTVTTVSIQTQVQTVVYTDIEDGSEHPATIINTQFIPTTVVQTVALATETKTVEPSITSVPFDNGQWHTIYYYRSTVTTADVSASVSSSSEAESVTSATIDSSTAWSAMTAAPETTPSSIASATASTAFPTSIDWSTYYGTWRETPQNGSWWGKRAQEVGMKAAGLLKLS